MKIRYRVSIIAILTIIFLVITPLLILWTLGYRYNSKKHSIEKTGLLIVKSEPNNADIYLNNKKQKNQSPAKIKYLLSGDYDFKLEKQGYFSFDKKIAVKSGEATFADNVILLKQNLPVLLNGGEIKALEISLNGEKAALVQNEKNKTQINIFDLKNETTQKIYETEIIYLNPQITWLNNDEILIYDPSNSNKPPITILIREPQAANIITVEKNAVLARYYYIKEDAVYYIKDNALFARSLPDGLENKILEIQYRNYIPYFIGDYWVLKNISNNKLLVLNQKKEIVFDGDGEKAIFGKIDGEFIVHDGFEMNIYNAEKKERNFVTRSSSKINGALFFDDTNYIIYALGGDIYAAEKPQNGAESAIIRLAQFSEIYSLLSDATNLYILGKINDKMGIYKMNLR